MTGRGWLARRREARQIKQEQMGDSPQRLAEHHRPKRDWGEMVAVAPPAASATAA